MGIEQDLYTLFQIQETPESECEFLLTKVLRESYSNAGSDTYVYEVAEAQTNRLLATYKKKIRKFKPKVVQKLGEMESSYAYGFCEETGMEIIDIWVVKTVDTRMGDYTPKIIIAKASNTNESIFVEKEGKDLFKKESFKYLPKDLYDRNHIACIGYTEEDFLKAIEKDIEIGEEYLTPIKPAQKYSAYFLTNENYLEKFYGFKEKLEGQVLVPLGLFCLMGVGIFLINWLKSLGWFWLLILACSICVMVLVTKWFKNK